MNRSLHSIISLSWQSVAYGIGVLGSQLIIYAMLPILTRYMAREEYGAVTVITALYAFLNTLTNAGLPFATLRFYSEGQDARSRRVTLGSSQLLFFLFALAPALMIILFAGPISLLLLGTARFALALQLAAGFLVIDSLNFYGTVVLRAQVRPLATSIQSIIAIAAEASLAVLFVIHFRMGVAGYWLGYLLGACIGLLSMLWFIHGAISFEVSREKVAELLKFGLPLIPTTLALTALRLGDRYIIGALAGLEQVAVYDVGYKLGSIIGLLLTPFRTAWVPYAFSIADTPDARRIYRDILTYLVAGCMLLFVGAVAFRTELIRLMAPASYSGAAGIVGWVAAAQIFLAIYLIFAVGPMIVKQTHYLAWAAVTAGLLNLTLNLILIPWMGILGAAVATALSYLTLAGIAWELGRRTFDMQVDWGRLLKVLAAAGGVLLLTLAAERTVPASWAQAGLRAAALVCFPLLLLLFRFVRPGQAADLLDAGRQMLRSRSASRDAGPQPPLA